MPEWDTDTRGQNRADGNSYFEDNTDWDGISCADFHQIGGRGIESVGFGAPVDN